MKLWAGRFSKSLDSAVDSFNSSISFDYKLYKEDIAGSLVHANMLHKQEIISDDDYEQIKKGLHEILEELSSGTLTFDMSAEDIHTFIEAELTKRIGTAGKKLHTARSRNDQVATDIKLYAISQCQNLTAKLNALLNTLCDMAEAYAIIIMPGYTHLQRAQPITFGHHLMAYTSMFLRDQKRLENCRNLAQEECPLGSGALAGTTYPIDRQFTAKALQFNEPSHNSLDGVSDRDFCIELLNCCSLIMMHLSRFSEEIILWCSWEFQFITLDDAFSTGSSIMPQKKNPDIAELVRGKTSRVYGDLQTLLTLMKGLPLAYNKDMQEDKEALFDGVETTIACLSVFTPMLKTITVRPDNMQKAASRGFINATDCADYLVKKGMAFRDAYQIVGQLVALCIEQNTVLEELPLKTYCAYSNLFDQDIYKAIALETCVSKRTSFGGPATVTEQVIIARKTIL